MGPLAASMPRSERFVWQGIDVEIRRNSRRRSRIAMVVDPAGFVVLDVPLTMAREEVQTLVDEHRHWLRRRLQQTRAEPSLSTRLEPEEGALIPFQGRRYPLRLRLGRFEPSGLEDDTLYLGVAANQPRLIRARLKRWYQQQALDVFYQSFERWRQLPWLRDGFPPWRQRYMRSQWGSCRSDGAISLNTHLIKVPPPLLDMVVLHELCHLRYRSHGPRFYGLMDRYLPEHRQLSDELERYQAVLLHDC